MTVNHRASTGLLPRALACGVALCVGVTAQAAEAHAAEAHAAKGEAHHWSYSGENGPEHWGTEDASFATCGIGDAEYRIKWMLQHPSRQ